MKKNIAILLVTAALSAACTYSSDHPSRRTSDNLAALSLEIQSSTVGAAVLVLSDFDSVHPDSILTATFDTIVTREAFANRFGFSASEMAITLSADSTWTFASTGSGYLSFTGSLHMTGRNSADKMPLFTTGYIGSYDEGNGFTADFSSTSLEVSWQLTPNYVEGYGYVYQYYMYRKGDTHLTTYLNSVKLDELKMTFDGTDVKY